MRGAIPEKRTDDDAIGLTALHARFAGESFGVRVTLRRIGHGGDRSLLEYRVIGTPESSSQRLSVSLYCLQR
jgi:hypothetical protein